MIRNYEIHYQTISVGSIYALVITQNILMNKKQVFNVTGVEAKVDMRNTTSSEPGNGVKSPTTCNQLSLSASEFFFVHFVYKLIVVT